jgi:serine/threonine-protein kinase
MLVFVGKAGATTRLYRRPMGSSTVEVLPGTEGAYAPFFSPDGKAVGYFSGGAVRRTNLDGSATVTLAELQLPYGGVWLDDGRIIVAANEGERLVAVPSSGGAPQPVGPRNVRGVFPEPVPGHDELLFTTDSHLMAVVPIAAEGRVKFLGPRGLVDADSISTATELLYGSHPKYIASGHIIYHTLSGARLESVWGAGQLVVTKDGTLIYARGENGRRTWLVWRDATGRVDTLKAFGREDYGELDLAPDGARLLVSVCPNQGRCGAQVLNINEGVRVVMPSAAGDATCGLGWQSCNLRDFGWNGSQRIYAAYVPATGDSMSAPFTLSSSPENATADSIARVRVMDVATDGTVLFRRGDSLYVAPDWSSIQHVPANAGFVIPQAEPWGHQVRGGGEWVAYTALNQQAGDYVVFLAHTKPPFENWRASPRGGEEPLWDRKGNLVYREGSRWMRVTPPASPGSRPGVATELFSGQYLNVLGRSHDIGPDGRNLLVAGPVETTTATLTVVTRWLERLQGSVAKP